MAQSDAAPRGVLLSWLLLLATLALAFARRIGQVLHRRRMIGAGPVLLVQFALGLYGGYFGGAVGLMMVAAWSLIGETDLEALNAPRTRLVSAANTPAVLAFVLARAVWWPQTLAMLLGGLLGGYAGARLGRLARYLFVKFSSGIFWGLERCEALPAKRTLGKGHGPMDAEQIFLEIAAMARDLGQVVDRSPNGKPFRWLLEIPGAGSISLTSSGGSPDGPFEMIAAPNLIVYRRPEKPVGTKGRMLRIDVRRGSIDGMAELARRISARPTTPDQQHEPLSPEVQRLLDAFEHSLCDRAGAAIRASRHGEIHALLREALELGARSQRGDYAGG